ncbi:hypothetical protein JCM10207_009217 [Rhodosporidiobolus poonsookiae]
MSTPSATSTATLSEGGIPISVLRLRGHAGDDERDSLIRGHEAAQQAPALDPATGLRTDREYPEPYEGPNPESWPVGRGVPDFRPLNTRRDAVSRPLGASTDQRVFVSLMMTGVFTIGKLHALWSSTLGRVVALEYPVGGQF